MSFPNNPGHAPGPASHTETFRVRHYECDAHQHLNNAVYLRYMQEAGIAAGRAVGLDDAFHAQTNRTWLPSLTQIDYLEPVGLDQTVQVQTWLEGLRRVMARRIYEFRLPGESRLVARGRTEWVFLDSERLRPVSIPEGVIRRFFPGGLSGDPIPRLPFPEPPLAPEGVFRSLRTVEWRDVDPMGHLNNAAYINYAEECVFQQAREYGWPASRMGPAGFRFYARQSTIQYLEPAGFEDELEISTWLYQVKPASGNRHYDFTRTRDRKAIARMQTLWVAVDPESGRPTRIPEDFLRDYEKNQAP